MKRVTSNLKNEVKLNNGVREASESIFTVMKIAIDGYKIIMKNIVQIYRRSYGTQTNYKR